MLTPLASSIVYRRLRFSRGSPPFLAAMMILRAILLQIFPRLASVAPLARLILDQCECPAIPAPLYAPGAAAPTSGCSISESHAAAAFSRRHAGQERRFSGS